MRLQLDNLDDELEARYTFIKAYQNRRLRQTYRDFIVQPEWTDVCGFFFGRVYNTDDTRARDQAIARLHARIEHVLGGDIVECLGSIIALQDLTIALDLRLLEDLLRLNAPLTFDDPIYEEAYRLGDNDQDRARQIDILVHTLTLGHRIFQRFGIGFALKSLHQFQRLRGDDLVTGFLLEAHGILHGLDSIAPLAQSIDQRERERLDRIYAQSGRATSADPS